MTSRAWRIYFVPGAVFQSLMIGGGYGTGREIVEYFSRYGACGGLLGLAFVIGAFSILLPVSYEFARVFDAYDYRRFFRELLGRGWMAFEILYLAMFALVLAVICAASGSLFDEYLHWPAPIGVATLLFLVVLVTFYGRTWVTWILAFKAALLCAVLAAYFAIIAVRFHERILTELLHGEIRAGWIAGAARYTLYASVVIPAMLFATRALQSRRQAWLSGITSAFLGILPAMLMHLSFSARYPEILNARVPAYSMITGLDVEPLTIAYLVVLFGSLFDVGLGFIQSINERLDGWALERRGRPLERRSRAAIAVLCVLVSGSLSIVGIVPLIARGYSAMAWGFLVLFVGPILTIGIARLARANARRQARCAEGSSA